jgi:hypothetical protein
VHGVWAEVKTLAIGEVQPAVEEQGERVVHTRNLSYFSRKVTAEAFQRLALVEMHRRGVEHAQEVAAIMDGAEWEQGFTDYHCPQATRILDFPHAAGHVNEIGEYLHGEHTPESQAWLSERLHHLKHEGPDELLRELHHLQSQYPEAEAISGNLAYLEKRQDQIQYPQFQAQGWPIGSGIVESGNKLVVEARLKGSGMHWAEGHVDPMLAIPTVGKKSGRRSRTDCASKPGRDAVNCTKLGSRSLLRSLPLRCRWWMTRSYRLCPPALNRRMPKKIQNPTLGGISNMARRFTSVQIPRKIKSHPIRSDPEGVFCQII